jgi:hypothetical protein
MAAANIGSVAECVDILEEMRAAGLPPGPRAYHGLVFAHVRDGDWQGALQAARQCAAAGTLLALVCASLQQQQQQQQQQQRPFGRLHAACQHTVPCCGTL